MKYILFFIYFIEKCESDLANKFLFGYQVSKKWLNEIYKIDLIRKYENKKKTNRSR